MSKEKQVNEKGWWDPTLGTSFCAWAKKTSEAVARANPRRVLSRKAVNASALDRDDDEGTDVYNKAFDDALSRNLMAYRRQLRNQDFARKYLSRMTKSLQTAFYIRWSWTPTQVTLIPQHRFLICL